MKRVTIRDIAKAAGVSVGTVQRALNDFGNISPQTRERVKNIAKKMGYEPSYIAQTFVTGKTYYIGVIVPVLKGIYLEIIEEIEKIAKRDGYVVCIGLGNLSTEEEDKCLEIMKKRYVDGIIIIPFAEREDKSYSRLVEISKSKPLVVVENNISVPELNVIVVDNYQNLYNETKYLIDHGRKRIGFIHWGATDWDISQKERLAGYRDCMRDNDLEDLSYEGSYRTLEIDDERFKNYLDKAKPEILIGQFDFYAISLMRELIKFGYRIPEDIEIIGYDNLEFGEWTLPSLSSYTQPGKVLAQKSMEILLNAINGKIMTPVHEQIKGEIVLRESTRPDLK